MCKSRDFFATRKNKYGYITKHAIYLRPNMNNGDTAEAAAMYIALFVPKFNVQPGWKYKWTIDGLALCFEVGKYLFPVIFFSYNTYKYLTHDDVDLRLDRVPQWLMSLVHDEGPSARSRASSSSTKG